MGINNLNPPLSLRHSLQAEAWLQPAVAAISKTEAILKFNFAPRLHVCVLSNYVFLIKRIHTEKSDAYIMNQ